MLVLTQIRVWCWRLRWAFGVAAGVVLLALLAWLRQLPFSSEPILYSYLQVVGSLLCFTYAANAMVRFRGTHDRRTLILAFGFVLSGAIETVATFNFYDILASGATTQAQVPLAWMVSRTLLALVLIAADRVVNAVERYSTQKPWKAKAHACCNEYRQLAAIGKPDQSFVFVGGWTYGPLRLFRTIFWRELSFFLFGEM